MKFTCDFSHKLLQFHFDFEDRFNRVIAIDIGSLGFHFIRNKKTDESMSYYYVALGLIGVHYA